jgi:arginyl-tRNA synthetase
METFQALLTRKLAEALTAAGLPQAGAVTPATDARFGDYQTNAALVLAKQLGQDPRALAQRIIGHLAVGEWCDPPAIAGAGFINLTLRKATIAKQTADLLRDERLGVEKAAVPKRIVIDFGSPNVAKPMHVGHIRSTVLGDALARIASFLNTVIRDNHITIGALNWDGDYGGRIYSTARR